MAVVSLTGNNCIIFIPVFFAQLTSSLRSVNSPVPKLFLLRRLKTGMATPVPFQLAVFTFAKPSWLITMVLTTSSFNNILLLPSSNRMNFFPLLLYTPYLYTTGNCTLEKLIRVVHQLSFLVSSITFVLSHSCRAADDPLMQRISSSCSKGAFTLNSCVYALAGIFCAGSLPVLSLSSTPLKADVKKTFSKSPV